MTATLMTAAHHIATIQEHSGATGIHHATLSTGRQTALQEALEALSADTAGLDILSAMQALLMEMGAKCRLILHHILEKAMQYITAAAGQNALDHTKTAMETWDQRLTDAKCCLEQHLIQMRQAHCQMSHGQAAALQHAWE